MSVQCSTILPVSYHHAKYTGSQFLPPTMLTGEACGAVCVGFSGASKPLFLLAFPADLLQNPRTSPTSSISASRKRLPIGV